MILSKQLGVYLNQTHCLYKQCFCYRLIENEIDLTPEQFLVIDILWDDGSMSQQEIANLMEKDKNSITKLVDGLEKREYVVREPDPIDRRKNNVVVTRKGIRLKRRITRVAVEAAAAIMDGIPDEELEEFVQTLHKLCHNMKKMMYTDTKNE